MSLLFVFIAGLAEGVMDFLQFHFLVHNKFWNPDISWKNKWKDGNPLKGEKFWQSSRALVFLTDGWHLMKFVRNLFIFASFLVLPDYSFAYLLMWVLLMRLLYGIGFTITYKYL